MKVRALRVCGFLGLSLGAVLPAHAAMDSYPVARLRMLDKVTARTSTFDVKVDTTVRFGQLYIKPRACRKAPPIETPESASFLQIWEVTAKDEPSWIFSGWMFASTPALSAMDHPIYDVWVLDCLGEATPAPAAEPAPAATDAAPVQAESPPSPDTPIPAPGGPAQAHVPETSSESPADPNLSGAAIPPQTPPEDIAPVEETPPPATEDPVSESVPSSASPMPAEPPAEDYEAEPSSVEGPVY